MNKYFNGTFPSLLKELDSHADRARHCFTHFSDAPVEALILGGGYGRGEGGVFLTSNAPQLFNDLDYFLFTTEPNNSKLISVVREFERIESEKLGIDVEITCLSPTKLKGGERSMMFHDLLMGHLVVVGPKDYLAHMKSQMTPAKIATIEATRLLWNRGSGLFFARCLLEDAGTDDFIYRQHMKLSLALGDALLCIAGRHSAFCETRRELFSQFDSPLATAEIRDLHAAGVVFKQRPHSVPVDVNLAEQNELLRSLWTKVFLSVESQRLGVAFENAEEYASGKHRLFPEEGVPRCLMIAIRDYISRGAALWPYSDYPRGALMRALVLLNSASPEWTKIRRYLPLKKTDWKSVSSIYETWWNCYS